MNLARSPRALLLRALATLLALLSLAGAARADATADEADFRFRRGAALYRAGKLDEALSEFLSSNRLVRNRNVLFNIARCFEQLKLYNEAWRAYSDLQGEPLKEADKKDLEAALTRLKPQLAILEVKSDPPGATVYVDRKDLGSRGQTPLLVALPPGKATAIVELEGHKPARAEALLAVGKVVPLQLALERIYGTLQVEGQPPAFELRVDTQEGEPRLTASGSLQVIPGRRVLHVTAPGTVTQAIPVDVPAEGTAQVRFKLVPIPPPSGTLVVQTNVEKALIKVDGVEAGFAPGSVEARAGKRRIELTSDNREPEVREVVVKANERTFLEVRMRWAQPRVVAAERRLTRAEDAPASITVISADEIRGFGYATLGEALRSVRGLYVTQERTYDAIGVRGYSTPGTNNNRVLVLNDGHVTNELSYGQGYVGRDFEADLSDVERIEVIRGPGSVLYGSAAFFAVVNVVHQAPEQGVHGGFAAEVGSNGGVAGHATLSAARGDKSIWLRGSAADVTGDRFFQSPDPSGEASGVALDLDRDQAQHADARLRLGSLSLSASLNSRTKRIPTAPFDTIYGLAGTSVWDRRAYVELAWNHTFDSGWGVDARVAYDNARYKGNWQYKVGKGYDLNSEDWVSGEARLRLPEFLGNRLFLGGEVQSRFRIDLESFVPTRPFFTNAEGNPLGIPNSEKVLSVYAGDELTLHPRLRVNAAVRADSYPDSFGLAVNPRVAVLAQPYDGGASKLIFGTAFRAPGFAERYFTDQFSQDQAVNLKAETVMTGEVEHVHQLGEEASLLVGGYWSRIEGLIGFEDVPGTDRIRYANLPGVTQSTGLETELRWQPAPGALIAFWYAWSRARGPDGGELPNSQEHSGALRLVYPLIPQVLSFATEVVYGGPRRSVVDEDNPARTVGETLRWNAGLAGAYRKLDLRYGVYVQNILDERILLPAGAEIPFGGHVVPQPGRVIRVQVSGAF